jgi:DNA-binding LacI/PurR family transcriptional regulator
MNINISKIAKMAKVSTATVSRVINNPEKVSAKTRERVESVISKLGYVPNQQARSLRSQQTKMIAIIVPHSADYLFTYPYFSIFSRDLARIESPRLPSYTDNRRTT